jgi:CheY-like chemotaxis protein
MTNWNLEPSSGSLGLSEGVDAGDPNAANLAAVLVIGKSNITRVVVSKIVERSGLHPVAESPQDGLHALSRVMPGTVILDGGADNCDCNHLYACLSDQRRASGRNIPRVILLSTRAGTPDTLSLGPVVDAVVAKPITPESLQPVVDRLLETARR